MSDIPIHVAVAVIRDVHGRILISRRPDHVHQGGRWEFPGGKVEAGESVLDALKREVREELDIGIQAEEPLIRVPHHYPDKTVLLDVWDVRVWSGQPHGREGQPVQWVEPQALNDLSFPEANLPIIRAAQLPDQYLITPEPGDPVRFLEQLERALKTGIELVQLRIKQHQHEETAGLIENATGLCHQHGARLLVNVGGDIHADLNADGVHLTSAQLNTLKQRPLPVDKWVGVSCHTHAELVRAGELGLDFAVYGPVKATASHPDANPIGWAQFAAGCDMATLPVYALGGMQSGDVTTSRRHGGQGIAAIRALWPEAEGTRQ